MKDLLYKGCIFNSRSVGFFFVGWWNPVLFYWTVFEVEGRFFASHLMVYDRPCLEVFFAGHLVAYDRHYAKTWCARSVLGIDLESVYFSFKTWFYPSSKILVASLIEMVSCVTLWHWQVGTYHMNCLQS